MGVVAEGCVISGSIKPLMDVKLTSNRVKTYRINSIEMHKNYYPEEALPGDVIALNLKNIERSQIKPLSILSDPSNDAA